MHIRVFSRSVVTLLVAISLLASDVTGQRRRLRARGIKTFTCLGGGEIPYVNFCDGNADCSDGSDEIHVTDLSQPSEGSGTWNISVPQTCSSAGNRHAASCLVERDKICSGEIECSDVTPCDVRCSEFYQCQGSRECVRRATVCNEKPCDGCEEDHGWKNGHGFKCLRSGIECVLPQQLLHDDIADCDGGTDLCYDFDSAWNDTGNVTRILNRQKCFLCFDKVTLIPREAVCDRVMDCPDLSDECLCEGRTPRICNQVIQRLEKPLRSFALSGKKGPGRRRNQPEHSRGKSNTAPTYVNCTIGTVKCSDGRCILRENVCDGIRHCSNDERHEICRGTMRCKDAIGPEKECRCESGESCRRQYGRACNGMADCAIPIPPNSKLIGNNTFPEDECEANCSSVRHPFRCQKPHIALLIQPLEHDGIVTCNLDPTDDSSKPKKIAGSRKCDGRLDCPLGDDEVNCTDRFECEHVNKPGVISIDRNMTCNGHENCRDGADETRSLCGESRFWCPALGGTKVNIDYLLVCDGKITCDNKDDERECKDDDRFYCEAGDVLFVQESRKFDGVGDCSDWSDECPLLNKSSAPETFSSRYELIGNPILRVFVWIMGFLSLVGNAGMIIREICILKKSERVSSIATANRILVINLAAADILMGIYLIGLGASGRKLQGEYCSKDREWRSSNSCIALGVLAVISSECAVVILALLAGCRVFAVIKPFVSRHHPKKKIVCLMILCAWGIACLLAFLPLAPGMGDVFIFEVQYKYNPFVRRMNMRILGARQNFRRRFTYDFKGNISIPDGFSQEINELTWTELEEYSSIYLEHNLYEIDKQYGYYSAESVCIPKFFATKNDPAWKFSFFVNLFNFLSFMFVAASYIVIQAKAMKRARVRRKDSEREKKASRDLHRKIIRLIFTDFCCWVPICIMAFCKLGGVSISSDAYAFAAIILLPINSALNPLLYSDAPDLLYKKILKGVEVIRNHTSSSHQQTASTENLENSNENRQHKAITEL